MRILTPFDLHPRIKLYRDMLRANTGDSLVMARMRREKLALYELVLEEIAGGNCPDPKTLAKTILEIKST